jgi:hypothetical protein
MSWYECIVNEVGPASDGSETSEPVIYINLTDEVTGAFNKTWFYAADGIQDQVLDVGIAAILSGRPVQVGTDPPNKGNQPFTEISRIYAYPPPPRPPAAPTNFHQISLSAIPGNGSQEILEVGWTDNSDNEENFVVTATGTSPSGDPTPYTFPANTETASIELFKGNTYTLYVVAWNGGGDSAQSNTIDVTVGSLNPVPVYLNLDFHLPDGPDGTGPVYYSGQYPPFGNVPAGHLQKIAIPSISPATALRFVKAGHSPAEINDPNAVVVIAAGGQTNASQMMAIFGSNSPPFSTTSPLQIAAGIEQLEVTAQPPTFVQIDLTVI